MNKILSTVAAALAGLALSGSAALAHPHVWVMSKSTIVYAPDGSLVGVRYAWTFDDMYSVFATQGLKSQKKGEFTREELQPLAQVNVESLKDFDFFTVAKIDGAKALFAEPKDYYLEFDSKNTALTLHFLLPLKTPVKHRTFDLEVFDPAYFVDFKVAEKDPVALSGAPAGCQFTIGKPQEMTADLARRLAEIPRGGQIPADTYGAQFANKIAVRCP